jgi:N-sulfoglucosamine sulfohydrolase
MYDYMRSDSCPLEELIQASGWATMGPVDDLVPGINYLVHQNAGIRYWGVTGLLIRKEKARDAIPALKKAGYDPSAAVSALAAETLYGLGEQETAFQIYTRILQDTVLFDMTDRNFALNSIDAINGKSPSLEAEVRILYDRKKPDMKGFARYNHYDGIMSEWLLKKWEVLTHE